MKWLLSICVLVTCTGCVSTMERPPSWPADKTVDKADAIAGTYLDPEGELTKILDWRDVVRDKTVRINVLSDVKLAMEFVLEGGSKKSIELPFTIENGWVIISHGVGTNRDGAVGYERLSFSLRPDATGALVAKFVDHGIGMMFFIPAVTKDVRWFRLEKAPNQPTEPMPLKRHGSS